MGREAEMSDKNQGWSLDVPTDPNKVATYSSSYVKEVKSGENMTRDDIEESLKNVSRKTATTEHDSSKPKK